MLLESHLRRGPIEDRQTARDIPKERVIDGDEGSLTHTPEGVDVYGEGGDGGCRPMCVTLFGVEEEDDDERSPLEIETAANADAVDVRVAMNLA